MNAMKTRKITLMIAILMMGAVIGATGQPERGRRSNHENNSRSEGRTSVREENQADLSTQNNRNTQNDARSQGEPTTQVKPDIQRETTLPERQAEPQRPVSGDDRRSHSVSRNSESRVVNAPDLRNSRDSRNETPVVNETPVNRPDGDNKGFQGNPVNPGRERNNPGYSDQKNNNNREGYNRDRKGEQGGFAENRNDKDYPNPHRRNNYRSEWGHSNYNRFDWEHRSYNWDDHRWEFSHYYKHGYIPWYFRNNRNYWFYPEYGHILRGFRYEPSVFYSGMIPYYFYEGFFYRYYPGIGYIWVEEPYDVWFNELPHLAVRVRIGGHIYFRYGNAYFRAGRLGFRLVLLPERYYERVTSIDISARF